MPDPAPTTASIPETLSRARAAVLVGFAIQGLTFASLVTRLAAVKTKLGLSDLDILIVLGATTAVAAVGSLLADAVARRWGSGSALTLMLLGVSLTCWLPGLSPSMGVLIALNALYGIFLGGVDAATNMQGTAVEDAYGRPVMSGFYAMWSAAAVAGAGYASVAVGLGLRLGFDLIPVAVLGVVANLATYRWLLRETEPARAAGSAPAAGPRPAVPWLPLLLLAVPTFAMWFGDSATSAWGTIYFADGLKAAASVGPVAYGAYQLLLLVVRLRGSWLLARYGAERVIRVSGVLAVVSLVAIVAAPHWSLAVVGFAVLGGSLALVPPASFVAARHLAPEDPDAAVARVNISNYVGYLAAAFLIAVVAEVFGARTMFVVPLVVALLIPLMAGRFAVPRARDAEPARTGS